MSGPPKDRDDATQREREAERQRQEREKRKDEADRDDEIDEALEETFPASDPPAHSSPATHLDVTSGAWTLQAQGVAGVAQEAGRA